LAIAPNAPDMACIRRKTGNSFGLPRPASSTNRNAAMAGPNAQSMRNRPAFARCDPWPFHFGPNIHLRASTCPKVLEFNPPYFLNYTININNPDLPPLAAQSEQGGPRTAPF
jgi:hypothetical protein